jgi:type II secretory pathway pseudopilin PulG
MIIIKKQSNKEIQIKNSGNFAVSTMKLVMCRRFNNKDISKMLKLNFRWNYVCNTGGFTLLETLVAISIIVTAVVAPLSLLSNNISASRQAQDNVTALYLAQDSIEYIRYIVGTNANAGDLWLKGLDDSTKCLLPKTCRVDTFENNVVEYTGAPTPLLYNASNGSYGYHSAGVPTKFTRSLEISKVTPSPIPPGKISEILVKTSVSWATSPGNSKSISLEQYIFNWHGDIE